MFIVEWIAFYVAIMFAMCLDNIFWISASPEYHKFLSFDFLDKVEYVIKDRVIEVLKHPRDIIPAIITSFILAVIF